MVNVRWSDQSCPTVSENRYTWTDEGLVDLQKAFSFLRRQTFCESAAARSDGRRTCSLSKWASFLQPAWSMHAMGNVLSTIADCSIVQRAHHAKCERGFDRRSVGIMQQISWRSEIDRPKALKEARRCQSVRKLLLPSARAPAKCWRSGPLMHIRWVFRVRQMSKVLRVYSWFGQAGKPTVALKWGGRTNRAELKRLRTGVCADA